MGFEIVRSFERPARLWGLFGSHCDEFVARRLGVERKDARHGPRRARSC
jgi:hypothetical protein